MSKNKDYPFHSVEEEAEHRELKERLPKTRVPSYELAFIDTDFLLRYELRSVRLQLEYLKAEMTQTANNIESTIVVYGSARIIPREEALKQLQDAQSYAKKYPRDEQGQLDLKKAEKKFEKSFYYEEARRFGAMVSTSHEARDEGNFVIMTGGGPGIMEGANRGASEVNGKSIGLSIYLPTEEGTNPYITPELHLQFHYFALRKMHFLNRARALVFFPGGFGTLDELFEVLTLLQTKKMKRIPVILLGKEYWHKLVNFKALVDEDAIAPEDIELFQFVDSAERAWEIIKAFYAVGS